MCVERSVVATDAVTEFRYRLGEESKTNKCSDNPHYDHPHQHQHPFYTGDRNNMTLVVVVLVMVVVVVVVVVVVAKRL